MRTATPVAPVCLPARPEPSPHSKVAAYCRVSTSSEAQAGSLEAQLAHYERLVAAHDEWEFVGLYAEAGCSGTTTRARPELKRLLDDCERGKINIVLTKSISRLARNTTDCLEIVRRLTLLGVSMRFEKEQIDTASLDSELMLGLFACLAEDESRSLSQNVKWGIRKRFESGTYKQSRPPYGYVRAGDALAVDPEKANVVRAIFAQALGGQGPTSIARSLCDDGIPSPTGKRWRPSTVSGVLSNVAYVGDMLCQQTFTDGDFHQCENGGRLDRYYVTGHHPAIVSREDFERVQALRNRELIRPSDLEAEDATTTHAPKPLFSAQVRKD